ncbi:DUF5372 family protein [Corallococcus aberystwythensis]|uniref:DUF5372 family protein n=1 Tax=Corallococcus aberystwythensis TaxID=2316722 RepID=UPI0034D1AE37
MVITHPLHPLAGRSLPLIERLRYLGRSCVVVRFPDGRLAKVPEEWTDLKPWPPPLKYRGKSPKLHPESLRELSALLDDLGHRSQVHDEEGSAPNQKRPRAAAAGRALQRTAHGSQTPTAGRAGRRAAQGRERAPQKTRGKR